MTKLFAYNFAGRKYETHEAFDDTVRQMINECRANGQEEDITRQVVYTNWKGEEVIENQRFKSGAFLLVR